MIHLFIPKQDKADIHVQFPEIAGDVILPMAFGKDKFFSSVLRIGSPNVVLWTHYDVCHVHECWQEPVQEPDHTPLTHLIPMCQCFSNKLISPHTCLFI